ncbi:inner membrane complex protein IMC3, putative [Eimeria brunetti]|uniref:Inner membrane complex protein IMC3, putative n=1 Tax=Eimeria brunetti TaxID=51314 RepID=U6LEH6_9EIME|nr:inner membrane complex protein IMC3, putative [Eimeria brunetti]
MSKKEDVAPPPEAGVDVLVQPLPHPSRAREEISLEEAAATAAAGEGLPYPGLPVSTAMPPPHEFAAGEFSGAAAAEEAAAAGAGAGATGPTAAGLHSTVPCSSSSSGELLGPSSRPPPQVMTALGPMPLPAEIRRRIPEKFVARPIIEEREIYIAKKEVQERTIEVPHVHYEHKFAEVAKSLKIKKIVPTIKEVIKEVPREVYKPVIEEKVIEVPQGVKYVEVPVEVPCLYPPKIVPRPKVQVVERIVETVRPVVQEKVVQVPQTVVKQIPKIKTVQVPYYVPRYVEKIIEVPYQPPDAAALPPILSGALPAAVAANMPLPFQLGPLPLSSINSLNLPYEAKVDVRISQQQPHQHHQQQQQQQKDGAEQQQHLLLQQQHQQKEGSLPQQQLSGATLPGPPGAPAIQLVQGFKWGRPPNAPPLPPSAAAAAAAAAGAAGSGAAAADGDPRMRCLPPLMVTCPPEVGSVNFSGFVSEPDILTREGVMAYSGFRLKGNFQMLFPPLPPQPGVPMRPPGTPDVRTIEETHSYIRPQLLLQQQQQQMGGAAGGIQIEAMQQKAAEIEEEYIHPTTNWCGQEPPPNAGTVYEQ